MSKNELRVLKERARIFKILKERPPTLREIAIIFLATAIVVALSLSAFKILST